MEVEIGCKTWEPLWEFSHNRHSPHGFQSPPQKEWNTRPPSAHGLRIPQSNRATVPTTFHLHKPNLLRVMQSLGNGKPSPLPHPCANRENASYPHRSQN